MLYSLPVQNITVDDVSFFYQKDMEVAVLRLDKLHSVISGNKWFKLRFYLDHAVKQQKKGLLTFGGAWSNHIVATAAACRLQGLQAIGIIRGEEPSLYSAALEEAKQAGMQLHFITRTDYKEKQIPASIDINEYLLVPEGGYGEEGARGASTILEIPDRSFTHYICAAGTGTMTAGLVNAAPAGSEVISISMLKNNHGLEGMITRLLQPAHNSWQLLHEYSLGGYAKHTPGLLQFMNEFYAGTGIPSDFVYTGKLFYAVSDLIKKSFFPAGSRLLVIHSGGLQGNRSLPKGTLIF
ncbi:MAG: pyridoxal-phosphate dependent enzyme [Chitinophagaceae bacterium]|nr:MAG: pyridoxal-phosphate dependent enzyme [Chitinophagaceae bacterium]